jgi:hypothetical protein
VAASRDIARAVEAAGALTGDGPIVVVFASAPYAEALANWIRFARRAGAARILVVALDGHAAATSEASGVESIIIPGITTRNALWVARAALFSELAQAGVDFVHSDADAIWLRPPIEETFSLGVDIAFSSGTVWPPTALARWGFVVCCGFFLARASAATAAFFSEVSERAQICGDDQVAVNEALIAAGLVWDDAKPAEMRTLGGQSFRTFAEPIIARTSDLSVGLLPHRRFPRLPEVSADTVVAHPYVPGAGATSIAERLSATLGRLGLWETPSAAHMSLD